MKKYLKFFKIPKYGIMNSWLKKWTRSLGKTRIAALAGTVRKENVREKHFKLFKNPKYGNINSRLKKWTRSLGKARIAALAVLILMEIVFVIFAYITLPSFKDVLVTGVLLAVLIVPGIILSLSIETQLLEKAENEKEQVSEELKKEKERNIKICEYYAKEPNEIFNVTGVAS